MQLKKLLQGSAFALVAAACAIAVPSVVKAATDGALTDAGITSVQVDGVAATMKITPTTNTKEVIVGIGKANTTKKTITVSAWDSYDVTGADVTVDLSKLNNVKDNYVVVSTPGKPVSIVKIKGTDAATKAKFNAAKGLLQAASGAKVSNSDVKDLDTTTGAKYEFKTAYSGWKDVCTGTTPTLTDMKLYQEEGAKLVVRLKGASDASAIATTATRGDEVYKYDTQEGIKVYESAATLPGKEAKVTVPAKAKGPKITVDYVKGTIKFPKNNEYRLAKSDKVQPAGSDGKYKTGSTTAVAIDTLTPTTDTDFGADTVKTYDVEVRTIATDKKAASKWSRVTITKPIDLEDSGAKLLSSASGKDRNVQNKTTGWNTPNESSGDDKKGGDEGIKLAEVKESTETGASKVLTIEYIENGKIDATKYLTKNAFTIKNDGKKTYEIVTGGDAKPTSADVKTTKVASGKTVKFTKIEDGVKVWIRVAGDKKTKTLFSKWAQLGVVDYPYLTPKKAATTTTP